MQFCKAILKLLVFSLTLQLSCLYAEEFPSLRSQFLLKKGKSPRMRTRLSVSPIISFYKINLNHAKNPKQKMSGMVTLKEEIRLDAKHTSFLHIGVEYMVHGINFNSYYFKPDSIQLYDGSFRYQYSLYIHEIDIPIQMKYSITRENNSLVSPYIMLGYHFRTLIFGDLAVKENGRTVMNKSEKITFKNPLFTRYNNPFVSISVGVQRNRPDNTNNCVFAEVSYRIGFSPYLLNDTFTPSSLYITGNHLAISLGIKF